MYMNTGTQNLRLLFLAGVLFSMSVQAQDLKISVNKKGKVGFVDQQGNEVVKCIYDSAMPFNNGSAIVTKGGKSGLIDATGKVVLPLKYTQISKWIDGIYVIKNGKTMGLAKIDGTVLLDAKYSNISNPNIYGKALIALGGKATQNEKKTYIANAKYGIIDKKGNILVTPKYKGLYEFSFDGEDRLPYSEGKRLEFSYHYVSDTLSTDCSYLGFSTSPLLIYKAGIMDGNGNEILKRGLYTFVMRPKGNMVRYYNFNKKQTRCGYHNLSTGKGFEVATFNYGINDLKVWSHGDFTGDIAPVNGKVWTFVDKMGKEVRSGYKRLFHSRDLGLWSALNADGKWEVFDEANQNVPSLSGYTEFKFPKKSGSKKVFSVQKDGGKYGVIDRDGNTVIPFEYDVALGSTYDVVPVNKDGMWGLFSVNGDKIIDIKYADFKLPTEPNARHYWVQKSDSLFYHYNLDSGKESKTGYSIVENFKDGYAIVAPINMEINDNMVTRAQTCKPNTVKSYIDAVDMKKMRACFGYLLNTEDVMVIDRPVAIAYRDAVIKKIAEHKGKKLTEQDKKNILLEVTSENRTYNLNATLGEEEWNY